MDQTTPTPVKHHNPALRILKRALWIVVLAGITWFVTYSIEQYNEEGAAEGIVVCDDATGCLLTTHIHADIAFDLCGQKPVLPRETGPLDGLHTHKEKNYLHFHDRVDLDTEKYKATGEKVWQYEESLTVQEVIDIFSLTPATYCEADNVEITVLVDGQPAPGGLEYNWKDGDNLTLTYTKK